MYRILYISEGRYLQKLIRFPDLRVLRNSEIFETPSRCVAEGQVNHICETYNVKVTEFEIVYV